jgi:hypothetical protein
MKSPYTISGQWSLSLRAALLFNLMACLAGVPCAQANADVDQALTDIQNTVTQVKLHMSATALQAHENEMTTALGDLNNLDSQISQDENSLITANQTINSCNAAVQSAQTDADNLSAEADNALNPVRAEMAQCQTDIAAFNAKYAGVYLTMPEPYNTYASEKARLAALQADINNRANAIGESYKEPYNRLLDILAQKKQAYQTAISDRDTLNNSLLTSTQQFQSAVKDVTDKLKAWLTESPDPSPNNVLAIKDGDAIHALIRAYNQKGEMLSGDLESRTRSGSDVVFDESGGSDGTLNLVRPEGSVPAPVEMQKNQAVHDLANGVSAAEKAVQDAQKNWDKIAHSPNSTAEDLKNADAQLTAASGKLMMEKFEVNTALVDCQKARQEITFKRFSLGSQ